jgi:hypothetical protein
MFNQYVHLFRLFVFVVVTHPRGEQERYTGIKSTHILVKEILRK